MQHIFGRLSQTRISASKFLLAIAVIICLGILGSFPLAAHLLPSQPAPATKVPTSTGPFTESECTATPKRMKYRPSSQHQSAPAPLSQVWKQAGRSQKDFANARACAATFVITYETFNSTNPKTFQSCASMLTDGARKRFYGTAPATQPDQHLNPMWQASLQKNSYRQTTQATVPTLLNATYTNGHILVWMLVPYHSTIHINKNQPTFQNEQMTVLLVGVPVNVDKTGTGWQVSDWEDGNTHLDPPRPL